MANKQLVLALFENETAADSAVDAIKQWDKGEDSVNLDAIGVLVKDDKGKIKTHKLGSHHSVAGAVLFGLAALLTGGAAIGLGLVGGSLVGAGFGALFHKGLKISDAEKEQLNKELDGGKAAVGIMADTEEVSAVTEKLAELGGQAEAYEVSDEAVEAAQSAAAEAAEDPADEPSDDPAEDGS